MHSLHFWDNDKAVNAIDSLSNRVKSQVTRFKSLARAQYQKTENLHLELALAPGLCPLNSFSHVSIVGGPNFEQRYFTL
jgi:hypothetical protein